MGDAQGRNCEGGRRYNDRRRNILCYLDMPFFCSPCGLYFGKKKKDKIQNKSFPVSYLALCFTACFRYFSEIS